MPSAKPSAIPRFASLAAWQATTFYEVGERVTNDTGKLYQATVAGTSAGSGGPTGTGGAITDGTVTWEYVAANAPAWGSGTSYAAGARVTNTGNGFSYQMLQAGGGTSTIAPTGTGARFQTSDGYIWQYLQATLAVVTQPSEGQKDVGWLPGQNPPAQFLNWLFHTLERWVRFLDGQFAADGVKRIRYVGTPTLLAGILVPKDGDNAIVGALGIYVFIAASSATSDGVFVITPTDATPGRWINTAAQLLFVTGSAGASPLKLAAPTGTNTDALAAVGDGTGAGVKGTGGLSSAPGVKGVGGATDGAGGDFTGTGDGEGVAGATTGAGAAVSGRATGTAPAVLGEGNSGPGAELSSATGPAAVLVARGDSSDPTGTKGGFCVHSDGTLRFHNGSLWKTVTVT